ncbi:MAG: hypothetical protein K0U93_27545 [Gammaproteobacteria bacterium]|nr:hypothetical protein [Gammaproteobacteria bacterium]
MQNFKADHHRALWPGGDCAVEPVIPPPRLDRLHGKRVGFLWDQMFRGEEIFPLIEDALGERFENISFVSHDAFGATFGENEHAVIEALPERLRELGIDAVISGIGA